MRIRTQETQLYPDSSDESRPVANSVGFTLVAAMIFVWLTIRIYGSLGPRSAHMALHILAMNAIAPLAAIIWTGNRSAYSAASYRKLIAGFMLQIGFFLAWHAPGVLGIGASGSYFHVAMHLGLFCSAFLFWVAVLSLQESELWRGVIALTLTGKLACLVGVLLLLAPRVVDGDAAVASALIDQRFAGLMMLAVCPMSYLSTAVHMTVRWLKGIEVAATRLCNQHSMKAG